MSEERRTNPNPLDIAGILAILYTIAYMGMVGLLFFKVMPQENKDLINTLVGIMSAVQMAIIQWVFGSSKNAEAVQRSTEQRQGRAEAVVQDIAKSVPVAAALAAGGPITEGDPLKVELTGDPGIKTPLKVDQHPRKKVKK